jgi:hypothetical protein
VSRGSKTALALVLYGLLVVLSLYPLSLHPANTVAYVGDSLESVYIVWWNVHQTFHSPLHLFDANVLYPNARALAFTDHRLLPSLAVAPILWATGNPVLACNVAIGLACLLAAVSTRRLATLLGTGDVGAWAAGALYAFHTYQINETPRLNIVFHGFIPLALAELLLLLRTGEKRRAWLTAGYLLLQGWSSNYHLLYGVLVVAAVAAVALVVRPARTAGPLVRLLLPGAVAALLFLPLALPYLAAAREHGYARELPRGVDLRHFVSTTPTNLIYGRIGADVRLQQQGPHFVGFVSLGLAVIAIGAAVRRWPRDESGCAFGPTLWVPAAAALATVLVVLSMGRDLVVFGWEIGPGPYRLLYRFLPGFQLVRIPERLSLLAMLFVALLVARGLALVRTAGLPVVSVVLAALVPLEHVSPLPVTQTIPVGARVPAAHRWLARHPTGAVAELPVRGEGRVRDETVEMYFSTIHGKPILHGYTAYPPLITRVLRRLAAEFPSPASLQAFASIGVDTVVVHQGRPVGGDLWRQLADRGETVRFRSELRLASLDLFDRLPPAVADGRLRLEAVFRGPSAALFESAADEVYRIVPGVDPPLAAAPFPSGRRIRGAGWRYRAKLGDPLLAADGDPSTAWVVGRALRGDEFFEVQFDRPLAVSGLVIPLRRESAFPTRFRVGGRGPTGRWSDVAQYDGAHELQLLERLRKDPREAAIGFDLGGRTLTGLSLLLLPGGTSFEGWNLPEVEVWTR